MRASWPGAAMVAAAPPLPPIPTPNTRTASPPRLRRRVIMSTPLIEFRRGNGPTRGNLRSVFADHEDVEDALGPAQPLEQGGRRRLVDGQDHHGGIAGGGPADVHVGDVDAGLAHRRSDQADDAGAVVVAHHP